jgi:alkylation response protein AidB-like acyl-CoA dehydrogenase
MPLLDAETLSALARHAGAADAGTDWPEASWRLACDAGVPAWSIPAKFGGAGLASVELLKGYEQLAGACLTTAFILSQREAAVRRLLASPAQALQQRFLPALARGEVLMSVGLAQLTTSRQHGKPALVAVPLGPESTPEAYQLDGLVPWVTAADRCQALVVGAPLPDGRQVLFVLPEGHTGVTIEPPLPLAALAGSRTTQVRCVSVTLGAEWVLAGPAEKVLNAGGSGVGGVETSCLALGLAGAAIDYLSEEAQRRPELKEMAARFEEVRRQRRDAMHGLVECVPDAGDPMELRVNCTRLVLQATQAALTVAKGTGFVTSHPAQRWARQALFFLVWSCPRPVAEGLLLDYLPGLEAGSQAEEERRTKV